MGAQKGPFAARNSLNGSTSGLSRVWVSSKSGLGLTV